MIKNIIFDFGQVLIHFEPSYMVGKYVSDERDGALLSKVVFDRLYWDKLDAGTISDAEVIEECKKRLPERLWAAAEQIYYNWVYNLPPVEGMQELVEELRERGIRLFLLSNISTYFAEHAHEFPVLSLFERCVFSAVCGTVKPSREIFEYICREGGILPCETLFIDDSPKNIKGAQDFGITGYLFDGDAARLREYLWKILE